MPDLTQIGSIFDKLANFGFAAVACAIMFLIYRSDQNSHAKELAEVKEANEQRERELRDSFTKQISAQNDRYAENGSRMLSVIEANTQAIQSLSETQKSFIQLGTMLIGELSKR